MAECIEVSVRELAEYACASGSLTASAAMARRMREGREGHLEVQGALDADWTVEAQACGEMEIEGIQLRVHGRADAMRVHSDCVEVLEIKTTRGNPYEICQDDYPVHWAQAEIYAYLFCLSERRGWAQVRLLYAGTQGGRQRFKRELTLEELQQRFAAYARPYALWARAESRWKEDCVPTLKNLRFPYADYRDGQREMARCVYRALIHGNRALIEAPTGIGKTAASLYGALKALGTGRVSVIFYLTARTTGRRAAQDALMRMRATGLKIRSVTLSAKEKVCPMNRQDCALCPLGDGYYNRRREALRKALGQQVFGTEEIAVLAGEHELCPFELSLDLTEIADVVICDYNYVFDPRVRLKRHFDQKSRAALLVDEAHNLPDRAREMYSAELSGDRVRQLRERIAQLFGPDDVLGRAMTRLEEELTCPDAEYDALREVPRGLLEAASDFAEQAERLRVGDEDTVELMLECNWFARVAKRFDEEVYRVLIRPEGTNGHICVRLWCFAPEKYLDRSFARVGGVALFSATLAPMDFYGRLLAVPDARYWLRLPSPFPQENLFVARLPVSVKYRDRSATLEQVAQIIYAMGQAHAGNYLACFPSHAYLELVYRYFRSRFPSEQVICQLSHMSEAKRQAFIEMFQPNPQRSLTAFIVLGGVFSEGVDLPDDRLSGAAIISTGIPQVNPESELLREMYDDGMDGGTDAAYTYPGFRRVLQAAGRVIRTETDRGVVLLLDQRYEAQTYLDLMPPHWQVRKITRMSTLNRQLNAFWKGKSD